MLILECLDTEELLKMAHTSKRFSHLVGLLFRLPSFNTRDKITWTSSVSVRTLVIDNSMTVLAKEAVFLSAWHLVRREQIFMANGTRTYALFYRDLLMPPDRSCR